MLTRTETALRTSPEPRFHLEMALLKLSQLRRLAPFEELLERFEALVSGKTAPPPSGSAPESVPKPKAKTAPPPSPAPPLETSSSERSVGENGESTPIVPADDSDFFGRLVEQLKASKPMLHALVSHNETARLAGDRLTLSYRPDQKVLAEQLQQKALNELLEEQASNLLGRKLSVKVELTHETTQADEVIPGRPPADDGGSRTLRERADRDPLVRRFIDTFQGKIESVQKSDV